MFEETEIQRKNFFNTFFFQEDLEDIVENSHNETTMSSTPSRPKPTKRSTTLSDEVLMTVNDHFKRPKILEDRFDFYAKNISMKLRGLPTAQRIIAEKIINDMYFILSRNKSHFVSLCTRS